MLIHVHPGVCLIGPVVQVTYGQQVLRRVSFIERGFHSLGQRKAQGIAGGIPSAVSCNLIRKPTPEQFFYQRIVGPVTVRGVRDDHLFAPFNIRLHLVRKGFGVFIRNPVVLRIGSFQRLSVIRGVDQQNIICRSRIL